MYAGLKITAWADNVGIFTSYTLSGIIFFSIPKANFSVEIIDDIGAIMDTTPESDQTVVLPDVEVRGVKFFNSYSGCLCSKVTPTTDKCNRCKMVQHLAKCSK